MYKYRNIRIRPVGRMSYGVRNPTNKSFYI